MTLQPGTTVGRYQILEPLGQGGMATVYKAFQPSLQREVALKVLRPGYAQDQEFRERFEREAIAIAKLRHPHIVQVFDFEVAPSGEYVLAMEFLEGGTLKDRLGLLAATGRGLDPSESVRILGEVASALSYAHEKGIVHRDVKPSNVMLTQKDWAVVTDFGIARILGATSHTQTGVGIGTPEYMAPEQGQGAHVDHRADIYSLGAMAYELLTGRVPYSADTPLAVVLAHIKDPLPLPSKVNPSIGPGVEKALLKALAKDPAARFDSAIAFADALKAGLAEDTKGGTLPTIVLRDRPMSGSTAPDAVAAQAKPPVGRRALVIGAVAAATVVLGAGTIFAVLIGGRSDTRPDAIGDTSVATPAAVATSATTPASPAQQGGLAVSGVVTSTKTAAPVAGVTVTVYRNRSTSRANQVATGTSAADGKFRLPVPVGTYEIIFVPLPAMGLGSIWWRDATNVDSATELAVSADMQLQIGLPEGHDIVGRVTDAATGQGLAVDVRAKLAGANCPTVAIARSDSSGTYRLPVPDSSYVVVASPPAPYLNTVFYRGQTCGTAAALSVRAGDVAGIDLPIARGSLVSGFVVDASGGAPIAAAHVLVYASGAGATGASNQTVGETFTDGQGRWSVTLADGTYRVRFDGPAGAGYKTQWWNAALSFPRATDVTVKGSPVAGITGQLGK